MSIKYAFKKEREGVYNLDILSNTSMRVPAKIFLTDELYDSLEDDVGPQLINACSLEGVDTVVLTPDTHVGYGIPIGAVVSSKTHLYPTAAGFDVNCGMGLLKTNLHVSDFVDKKVRRLFIEKVTERVPTGKGKHRAPKQRNISDKLSQDILRRGLYAFPYVADKDKHERMFLPITREFSIPQESKEVIGELGSLGGG